MPQLIINATVAQATRIANALGKERGLVDEQGAPRAATAQEVEDYLRDVLKRLVLGVEYREAQMAVAPPTMPDLT